MLGREPRLFVRGVECAASWVERVDIVATLAEIANNVLNRLQQIDSNTSNIEMHASNTSTTVLQIRGGVDQLNLRLTEVHGTLNQGFAFLGQGLHAILEAQREANAHLATQVDQNDVILCWLTRMAELLCAQLREIQADLAVHVDVLATLRTLEGVLGLVHARELVEHQHKVELEEKLAQCCPVRPIPMDPCFQPCREPRVTTHEPSGQDWDGRWRPEGTEPPPVG